jgi:PAS domain S-box-containing protein
MKILYVEDELAHVELTERTLEDNLQDRFVLYHVDSLRGALKMLETQSDIDLVLTDLRLPDGSGMDLLNKVKEMPHAPAVVLVTGQGDEKVAVNALKAGAADYLVKEGDYLHRLPAALKNAVAQNQLAREQAALRAAEQRFRILVEQLPAAVYTDNDDEYSSALYVSPQIEEISGYAARDWLADPTFWLKRLHPDDLEPVMQKIRETHESLSDFNADYRLIHRDGHVVWVRDFAKIILDEEGNRKYWQGILFDITQEVEAQATLRASEERFRLIFHSTPIATCVVSLEEGRFIDANQAFQNLVGLPLDQLTGHTSTELGFWESTADRESFLQRLKATGSLTDLEFQYNNVPNGPKDTLAYYQMIELGKTSCLLAMFYDVTEQKKAKKALEAERDFALQVLNNMGQGLTVTGANNNFEYVNPAYARILGRSSEEIIGKLPSDFAPQEDIEFLLSQRAQRKQGIISTYETNIIHSEGYKVPVTITGVPRVQDGKIGGSIAVVTDLTFQKQAELALERQVKELTVLHAVATAEVESQTEDEIIERVTKILNRIYSEVCGILTLDKTGKILMPHPSYLGADVSNWRDGYPITDGVTGRVVVTGRPVLSGNISAEQGYIEIASEVQSELCVPIRLNENIIGVLNVESRKANAFDEKDELFLNTIASGLGTAIERMRLFKAQETQLQREAALLNLMRTAASSLDLNLVLQTILNELVRLIPSNAGSIQLLNRDQLNIVATIGAEGEEFAKFSSIPLADFPINRSVVTEKHPIRIDNVDTDNRFKRLITASKVKSFLAIPLIVKNQVMGLITLDSYQAARFTAEDEELAMAIANHAGIAIENAQLYQEAVQAAERRAVLHRISQDIVLFSQDTEQVYKAIHEAASKLMPCDVFLLVLRDEIKDENTSVYAVETGQRYPPEHVPGSQGLTGTVITENRSIIFRDNLDIEKREVHHFGSPKRVQSVVAVPMRVSGRVIGMISAQCYEPYAYAAEEQALLEMLSTHAATAIENARLFEAEQRRRQEAEALRQATSVISSTLDPDIVSSEVLTSLKKIIPYDTGTVFILEGDVLRVAMAQGYPHMAQLKNLTFPADNEFFQIVKATGKPIIVEDAQLDPRFQNWGESTYVHGWMIMPLVSRGRVIGSITLDSVTPGAFDENIGNTAMAFAHQAAAAIDNARLHNETQRRLKDLEIINRVTTALRMAHSGHEILNILLSESLSLLDTQNGAIWLYDHSHNTLKQHAESGVSTKATHKILKPEDGIIGHVFNSGEKYIALDLKRDSLIYPGNVNSTPDGLTGIFIPIKSTIETMGVLLVSIEAGRQVSDEINLLAILAEVAGNAMQRAELFDQSQEQIRKLTTLRDIDSAIASSTDLRVILNILMDHTLRHLKTDAVDILLYHPELQSLTYLTSAGFYNSSPSRPLIRLGEGLAGQAVMKGSIEYVADLRTSNEGKRDPLLVRESFIAYFGVPLIVKGQIKGVFEVFHRRALSPTNEWLQFLQTLAGQAAIAIDNAQLFDNLQRSNQEIIQAYDTTLEGWARALELRDRETEGHTRRVTDLTMQLARFIGIADDDMINIYRGVLLHDIGKMGVPDQILRKTGALNEAEWSEMRRHPEYAFNLLAPIPYLRPALDIPYCHHEHWDGSGYPRGLKGEQIPLSARIFSVVDIWDALLSDRPYRKAWPQEKVIQYLRDIAGSILDPQVVTKFLQMINA